MSNRAAAFFFVNAHLPAFLVGSVLLFGLVLHLFHRRALAGYVGHVVFSLHWSAFFLLLVIADRLLPASAPGELPGPSDAAIALIASVYLGLAVHGVYGKGWLPTALKTVCVDLLYQVLLSIWMLSAIALAFAVLLQSRTAGWERLAWRHSATECWPSSSPSWCWN